jgi:flagellin
MRIATNTTSYGVWTSYTKNLTNLQGAMGKLSTGTISNTDDPAGIGIGDRMGAQINSTDQAYKNTQNGTSLLQTADSWLSQINDDVTRMKTLAVESNGISSSSDVSNLQTEYKSLQQEVTRITSQYTSAAKFNGLYLFRGGNGVAVVTGDTVNTNKNVSIQIGADVNQKIDLSLSDLQVTNTNTIGTLHTYSYDSTNAIVASTHQTVSWHSIIDVNAMSVSSAGVTGKLDQAINFIATARASMGAQQSRLEKTSDALLSYEDNLNTAKSKITDIDMAQETTAYSTYSVLTSAANSMLAQANQLPQNLVLSLLQG